MKLLIHDLDREAFYKLLPGISREIKIIADNGTIHPCIGCFGCWVKTPGRCVIRDEYGEMGEYFSKCEEVIIISQCCYGGFSPFVKNVMDRSISYIHPYFEIRHGKMHHRRRYENKPTLHVWFYGENRTKKEEETAKQLITANLINLDWIPGKVTFFNTISEIEEKLL